MSRSFNTPCPDCSSDLSRRRFMTAVGGAALVGAAAPILSNVPAVHAAPSPESKAETAVGEFYASLSEQQKKAMCFPFDHQLRTRISANWHVAKPLIGDDFYSDKQRAMIDQIIRNVTSEDGYKRTLEQMDDDDGGVNFYSVAVFGKPGSDKFQWELTGRHLTLRADGDSVDRAAFGGPIVYGHGLSDPQYNLYHYQTKKTNEVFNALDSGQHKQALLAKAPNESAVKVQGEGGSFPGITVGEMSEDQQALVASTLKTLLAPYRQEDVNEVMAILEAGGGLKELNMAFYQQGDLKDDKVWDIWRVEGPSFVWHFRGAPHVHAYINIGQVG